MIHLFRFVTIYLRTKRGTGGSDQVVSTITRVWCSRYGRYCSRFRIRGTPTWIQNGTRQIRFIFEEVLELARAQEERGTQDLRTMSR